MGKRVTFKPYDLTIDIEEGENLLRAALQAGVHINASCGGGGVCGKCRVLLDEGTVECPETTLLTPDECELGYRQACQCRVLSDVVVRIPPESLLDRATITRRRAGLALRPSPIDIAALRSLGLYNPAFQKKFLALPKATLGDNVCDLSRLENSLSRQYALNNLTLDFLLVRKLAKAMREQDSQVTATLDFAQEKLMKQRELRDAIQRSVQELPEDYRSVVVLRDLEGLSNEEVSNVLHLSVAAVKSRLHRGRLVLREKLLSYL